MKTTNYRLQTQMEQIKPTDTSWYKNYVRELLESGKPYYAKADYIGLSFQELETKIDYLGEDIKELQRLRKKLENAKDIAQIATAEVLEEYGIDRLDGTCVSSITITPSKTKSTQKIVITDSASLIKLGYVNVTVDEKAVAQAMLTIEGLNELDKYVSFTSETITVPAKVKVNLRRTAANTQADALIELVNAA
jgi:hypothetical protein